MQNDERARLAADIKSKKYIDEYIERWLKLDAVDKPYVECEICKYASNASIHQHLLIPEEYGKYPNKNRILHLCSNCYYELRALMDKHRIAEPELDMPQMCEEAFEELMDIKKPYREAHRNLERIVI